MYPYQNNSANTPQDSDPSHPPSQQSQRQQQPQSRPQPQVHATTYQDIQRSGQYPTHAMTPHVPYRPPPQQHQTHPGVAYLPQPPPTRFAYDPYYYYYAPQSASLPYPQPTSRHHVLPRPQSSTAAITGNPPVTGTATQPLFYAPIRPSYSYIAPPPPHPNTQVPVQPRPLPLPQPRPAPQTNPRPHSQTQQTQIQNMNPVKRSVGRPRKVLQPTASHHISAISLKPKLEPATQSFPPMHPQASHQIPSRNPERTPSQSSDQTHSQVSQNIPLKVPEVNSTEIPEQTFDPDTFHIPPSSSSSSISSLASLASASLKDQQPQPQTRQKQLKPGSKPLGRPRKPVEDLKHPRRETYAKRQVANGSSSITSLATAPSNLPQKETAKELVRVKEITHYRWCPAFRPGELVWAEVPSKDDKWMPCVVVESWVSRSHEVDPRVYGIGLIQEKRKKILSASSVSTTFEGEEICHGDGGFDLLNTVAGAMKNIETERKKGPTEMDVKMSDSAPASSNDYILESKNPTELFNTVNNSSESVATSNRGSEVKSIESIAVTDNMPPELKSTESINSVITPMMVESRPPSTEPLVSSPSPSLKRGRGRPRKYPRDASGTPTPAPSELGDANNDPSLPPSKFSRNSPNSTPLMPPPTLPRKQVIRSKTVRNLLSSYTALTDPTKPITESSLSTHYLLKPLPTPSLLSLSHDEKVFYKQGNEVAPYVTYVPDCREDVSWNVACLQALGVGATWAVTKEWSEQDEFGGVWTDVEAVLRIPDDGDESGWALKNAVELLESIPPRRSRDAGLSGMHWNGNIPREIKIDDIHKEGVRVDGLRFGAERIRKGDLVRLTGKAPRYKGRMGIMVSKDYKEETSEALGHIDENGRLSMNLQPKSSSNGEISAFLLPSHDGLEYLQVNEIFVHRPRGPIIFTGPILEGNIPSLRPSVYLYGTMVQRIPEGDNRDELWVVTGEERKVDVTAGELACRVHSQFPAAVVNVGGSWSASVSIGGVGGGWRGSGIEEGSWDGGEPLLKSTELSIATKKGNSGTKVLSPTEGIRLQERIKLSDTIKATVMTGLA